MSRAPRRIRYLRRHGNIPKGIDLHVYDDGHIGWVAEKIHRDPAYDEYRHARAIAASYRRKR